MSKIIHEKKQAEPQLPVLVLNTGKPKRRVHKLGIKERKIVLESLLEHFDLASAAAKVGVTYNAIKKLIERDEQFAASVEEVHNAWIQNHIGIAYKVGAIPSREGAIDRWKVLEAALPERFGKKVDVNIRGTITHENADMRIQDILSRFGHVEIVQDAPEANDKAQAMVQQPNKGKVA